MTDSVWPERGTISVEWQISLIDEQPRLGWTFRSEPELEQAQAIRLLRDVAAELEIDLPESD
jgi:hypothetical protein